MAFIAFVLITSGISMAHMDPYVIFVCRFTDNQGNPLNNHFAILETAGPRGQAEIVDGEARVIIGFRGDYKGKLTLKVYDKRRQVVELNLPSGEKAKELVYEFSHVLGSGLANNSEFGNFLEDGVQYVSVTGLSSEPGQLQSLAINWNWDMVSEKEKKDIELHRLIDEKNLAEFRRKLALLNHK